MKVCQKMGGEWKKIMLGESCKWSRPLSSTLGARSGGKEVLHSNS